MVGKSNGTRYGFRFQNSVVIEQQGVSAFPVMLNLVHASSKAT